jgi:hypothetical protein
MGTSSSSSNIRHPCTSVARSMHLADLAWTAKQRSDFVQNFWAMELEGSGWNIYIDILGWLIVNR